MRYLALYAEGYTASTAYGGTAFVIRELQAYETSDASGTNYALGNQCYASNEYNPAENGCDGDVLTTWIAHHSTTEPFQWWCVDLGVSRDIILLRWIIHATWTPSQVGVFVTDNFISPPTVGNGWQRVATLNPAFVAEWQLFDISLPTTGATVPIIDGWNQTGALIR